MIFQNSNYTGNTGTKGQAPGFAYFNGKNSYITTGTAGLPLGSSPRSVFAWVYPAAISTNVIFCYGTVATQELSQLTMIGGYLRFGIDGYYVQSTGTISPNTWNFVGYTYAGGAGNVIVYVNGQSTAGNLGALPNTVLSATDPSNIGEQANNNGYFWYGSLADVQVYNAALTPVQALQLYAQGFPPQSRLNVSLG